MKQQTTIPFSGFYDSIHSSEIESRLELECSDDSGEINPELLEQVHNLVDWKKIHTEYARLYVESLEALLELELEFSEVVSPREYNFETDRVFCSIPAQSVSRMLLAVDLSGLDKLIAEKFTSYSGFISRYPNSLSAWMTTPISRWDHNQVGTLLEYYWMTEEGLTEISQMDEYYLVEDLHDHIRDLFWENDNVANILNYFDANGYSTSL